ncbi:Asp-domain-containing protein [Thozetella sp. PMI_491]|nr:Asp-domain-containing protein [Thozetella sp. PMI_491]
MQTFGAFLVSFLAASGLVAAMPATTKIGVPSQKGQYSVTTTRNPNARRNGAIAREKIYMKYGKPVPADVAAAAERARANARKRSTGSATTTSVDSDLEWLTPVQIGTPAQTLNLDFDTGSSDLWVFSSETTGSTGSHTKYKPSSSSTSKKLSGATWSITYGDNSSSSGDVYTDVVTVGGLTVTSQAVESAKKVSSAFVQDPSDGLLGLAFSSINTVQPTQQNTFFDNAKSSLNSALFTADLKHEGAGKYNFGYIDTSAYTGSITYTTVDSSQGFWGFTSKVGSSTVKGIADTGTTLLALSDTIVNNYYSSVSSAQYNENAGGISFDCSEDLPDFQFKIGSTTFTIPAEYLNFGENEDGSCFGGLQSDADVGISIYGDIALKAAFVVFDAGNNRLGWANKNL